MYIDDILGSAVEKLLSVINPEWLRKESEKPFRLEDEYLDSVLSLVGSHKVESSLVGPQRFARSLLLCKDYLEKRDNLDFWHLPIAITEIIGIDTHVNNIAALGPNATDKFKRLPAMTDNLASSSIYELMVGLECIKQGLDLTMLEDGSTSMPTYRVNSLSFPTVVQCRRRRVCDYLILEGIYAEKLFRSILPILHAEDIHASIEVNFHYGAGSITESTFVEVIKPLLRLADISPNRTLWWGNVTIRPLSENFEVHPTRLYSPAYLEQVFGWILYDEDWDGIVCKVAPPSSIVVNSAKKPSCLKWKYSWGTAEAKRNRALASLFSDALQQVPGNKASVIYLCYEEYASESIADRRMNEIIDEMSDWFHRKNIDVPLVVVNRLTSQPMRGRLPDMIDSASLFFMGHEDTSTLSAFPSRIFVPELV